MLGLDDISKMILNEVADITDEPQGAYNFRVNSGLAGRNTTENINIVSKENGSGIDIFIKPDTKGENVHIPVVISESGVKEKVYNDFFIGDNCDVTIVAGCGIDNCGAHDSQHDGIHRFYVGKNSRIKYVEKHYGSGNGEGKRILNPVTEVYMEENGVMEMEMEQIKGVDSTDRMTIAELKAGAKLLIKERLMTHGSQTAVSGYKVSLNGEGSTADVVSRSQEIPLSKPLTPVSPATLLAAATQNATRSLWTAAKYSLSPLLRQTTWTLCLFTRRLSAKSQASRL